MTLSLDALVDKYSTSGSEGGAPVALPRKSVLVHVPAVMTEEECDMWITLRTLSPAQEALASRGQGGKKRGQPSGMETCLAMTKASMWRYYADEPADHAEGGTVIMSKHRDVLWHLLGGGRGLLMEAYMELARMIEPEGEEDDAELAEGN